MNEPENTCPELLRFAFHELLRYALIFIRSECNDSKFVFAHSDHVHNVPTLLSDFQPERLRYYWEVERPCFIRNLPEGRKPPERFEAIWVTIEREYLRLCTPTTEPNDNSRNA